MPTPDEPEPEPAAGGAWVLSREPAGEEDEGTVGGSRSGLVQVVAARGAAAYRCVCAMKCIMRAWPVP